jgi:hypothetical protein
MVKGILTLFLISVCILALPDKVNCKLHSDDYIQMGWNQIRRDIFRESPSAPQKFAVGPPGIPPAIYEQVDRKF